MTPRRRNSILILVCGALIFALPMLEPKVVTSPHGWDWRLVTSGPFVSSGEASSAEFVDVRVLTSPDASWTAELLWSTGVQGVRVGPPSTHARAREEVWVLSGDGCALEEAVAAHVAEGGGLVSWSGCEGLGGRLGAPPPATWADPSAMASVRVGEGSGLRHLALPAEGLEWPDEEPGALRLSRVGGAPLAARTPFAVHFGFDVADWVMQLRQGDPELAGIDRDGVGGTTPDDLRPFPWASPTWRTPSADLWVEVVVATIEALREESLPRLWPLPSASRTALVLTIDQGLASAESIPAMLTLAQRSGAELSLLTTWGTRQSGSASATDAGGELLADADLARAQRWGHGLGIAPNGAGLASPQEAEVAVREHMVRVSAEVASPPRVVRNHGRLWWGLDAPSRVAADLGLWMELNFVSTGPRFGGPGFGFGSARPVRFRAATGGLLPLLSMPTQISDRALLGEGPSGQGLDIERALLGVEVLLDNAEEYRIPLVASVAPGAPDAESAFYGGLLEAAAVRGIPVMSAERYATWAWDHRRRVSGFGAPDEAVPQLQWTPGSSCEAPLRASPLSGSGCLPEPAPEP